MRWLLALAGFAVTLVSSGAMSVVSAKEEKVLLWPDGRTPSVSTNQAYAPYFVWFTPKETKSDAVLISVSGGSYTCCGIDWFEVAPVRDYFLKRGVNVVTMLYRTPRPIGEAKHLTAWQDAQRTVRLVRREAVRRGLNPENIGFTGCSAGGHLALMTATSSETPAYSPVDETDKVPCHVNWAIPVYPAYVLESGSNGCNRAADNLAEPIVSELAFDAKTPPMCFFHGDADGYSPMGSVRAYHRLRTLKIPAELHVMALEEHCFQWEAMPGTPAFTWKDRMWEWLAKMDFVTPHPARWPKTGWTYPFQGGRPLDEIADCPKGSWRREGRWSTATTATDAPIWFKGEWTEFTLDFEYLPVLANDTRSAVLLRAAGETAAAPVEIDVLTTDERKAGEWNRVTLWVKDGFVRKAKNGRICRSKVVKFPGAAVAVGFAGANDGKRTYFRNVRIRPGFVRRPTEEPAPEKKLPTVRLLGDSIRLSYQAGVSERLFGEAVVSGPRVNCASTWHWLLKGRIGDVYLENRRYDIIHANVGIHDSAFRRDGSGNTDGGVENNIFPERYPEFEGNFDMTKQGFPGDLTYEQRESIVRRLGFHVRTSPEEYEANLRRILRELKQHADTVIFALTTPCSVWATRLRVHPLLRQFNDIARRVCAEEGVLVDDLETAGRGLLDHQLNDGTHFDPTGVEKLADAVADSIRKSLKEGAQAR